MPSRSDHRPCSDAEASIVETERWTPRVRLSMLQVDRSMLQVQVSMPEVQVSIGRMERRSSAVETCTRTVRASWSRMQWIDTRHGIFHRHDGAIHRQHGRLGPPRGRLVPADGRFQAQHALAVGRDRPLPILPASGQRSRCLGRMKVQDLMRLEMDTKMTTMAHKGPEEKRVQRQAPDIQRRNCSGCRTASTTKRNATCART